MITSGHLVHLYCDCAKCTKGAPHERVFREITNLSEGGCFRQAGRMGWRFTRDKRKAYAPGHKKP